MECRLENAFVEKLRRAQLVKTLRGIRSGISETKHAGRKLRSRADKIPVRKVDRRIHVIILSVAVGVGKLKGVGVEFREISQRWQKDRRHV